MNKRSREYFKWLKFLNSGEYELYERYCYRIDKEEHESFMGLISYIEAKTKGIPVSEFQDRCWKYGTGLEKRNES